MSIPLTISGQVIQFPSTAQNPDWSEAVIQFAQAVTAALQGVAGPFDVSPQTFTLDSYNPSGVNVTIPLLSFPVSNVRSVLINYSLIRTTTTTTVADAGTLQLLYNPSNSVGNKWEIARDGEDDTRGAITFSVTDAGVVQFATTAISGFSHMGALNYSAKALVYA